MTAPASTARHRRARDVGTQPAARGQTAEVPDETTIVRRVVARHRQTTVLMLLVGLWVVVPRTIQTLTAAKFRLEVGTESPPYTLPAALTLRLLVLAILAMCVFVLLDALRDPFPRPLGGLVVLTLPWLYLELRDWSLHQSLSYTTLVYPALVLALWALRPALHQLQVIGYLVGSVALLSMVIAVLLPARAIFRHADGSLVTQAKELVPGGILVGIFTHGNNLGQFLVLGLPLVALIRHVAIRHLALLSTVAALLWSASRSSLLALAVASATVLVLALLPPDWRGLPARTATVLAFAVVAVLPLVTRDPQAYSNRGYVWLESLLAWRSSPLLGLGSNYYAEVATTSAALGPTVFHGHNQVVHLLVTGGLVAVVLVAVLIATATGRAVAAVVRGRYVPVAYLLILAGACTYEVSLALVDNVFLFPVVVLPLAVIIFADAGDAAEPADAVPRRALLQPPPRTSSAARGRSWL